MTFSISISDGHDGGNIQFVKQRPNKNDPSILDVVLQIKPDPYTILENIAHMQYFSFRVMIQGLDESPKRINYILENAQDANYPEAWPGTTVFYTDDVSNPDSWKRNLDTFYTEGTLHWEHEHQQNGSFYFSYFPLFSYERHLDLINKCCKRAKVETLGKTLDGRELECVNVGTGPLVCWIIHRQHPGEVMAEFYAEGLLTRLLGLDGTVKDETVHVALEKFTFYIVPCMCPDGAVRGHLRTNASGANLNREWTTKNEYVAPTMERSPEVYCVLQKMDETGVDFFLDVHGDEELPFNFLMSTADVPNWGKRLESLHGAFCASYTRHNSDMQQKVGYPPMESPKEVLKYMNVANNQVCHRFDCLAMTLEMPFKDCMTNKDPEYGWSPARSRKLGASVLEPLLYVEPYLRAEGEFWKALPPEDAFIMTSDDYDEEASLNADEQDEGFKMMKKRIYSDVREFRKNKSATTPLAMANGV